MAENKPQVAADGVQGGKCPAPSGEAAIEVAVTRPFEGFFFIRKEWEDQEDGVERVTLNYTLSRIHLPADWSNTNSSVMMPEWGTSPLRRTWIIRLPTHLEEHDRYLFHYYFHVYYTNGSDRVSHTFTQKIAPRAFEFLDHSGDFLFVRLHWSIGAWTYPQDNELEADGIEWGAEHSVSNVPYRGSDRLFQDGRQALLKQLPVPRRFRGLIWPRKVQKSATVSSCCAIAMRVLTLSGTTISAKITF